MSTESNETDIFDWVKMVEDKIDRILKNAREHVNSHVQISEDQLKSNYRLAVSEKQDEITRELEILESEIEERRGKVHQETKDKIANLQELYNKIKGDLITKVLSKLGLKLENK